MRFKTIWTIPAMAFGERLKRTRDWAAMKVAKHLPVRIRYWVTMLELGKATYDSPNVTGTKLEDILDNLERPKVIT